MNHFWRDARFALRQLRRSPGFTLVAVVALAMGIGASTALFSLVHGTFLEPLPFEKSDQLVMVWSQKDGRSQTSVEDFRDWKQGATSFQALNAWTGRRISLAAVGERPEGMTVALTTPGWITMHGHRFVLGRDFLEEEGEVGRENAVILTHRLWVRRFASDRGIVGRTVRVDGKPHIVVGVIARGPADRAQSEAFLPLTSSPDRTNRTTHWLLVMGRLKEGVTVEQANAEMVTLSKNIADAHPETNKGWSASVEPLQNNFLSDETKGGMWLALGATGFVLLIGCANVANLLLARGASRRREVAVRSSLGAPARQIFTQFLTESLVLATIGGILGVGVAEGLVRVILAMIPPNTLPSEANVRLNVPVLIFTLLATTLAGVLAGCAPALQAMRSNIVETLNEAGRSLGGGRNRLRSALVVAEFALAIMLLSGGGIAVGSLVKLTQVELGFNRENLMTAFLPLPGERIAREQLSAFYDRLLGRVRAIPGVEVASVSSGMPAGQGLRRPFELASQRVGDRAARPRAGFNMVSPAYFETFGIGLKRGRAFTDADVATAAPVAIVNEAFVAQHLPAGADPLTERVVIELPVPASSQPGPSIEWQIVGISRDVRNLGPRQRAYPEIDVPFAQSPWAGTFLGVRTSLPPDRLRREIAASVAAVDPDLPTNDLKTMDETLRGYLSGDRFRAFLFGGFAFLALGLATAGIYGVMSFAVVQRTQEIGLRMAIGAGRAQVIRHVLRDGMANAMAGAGLGVLGAFALARVMKTLSVQIEVVDPVALAVVAGMLLSAALLACLVPALRAAAVDPMIALRKS